MDNAPAIIGKKIGRPLKLQPDEETLRRLKEYASQLHTQNEVAGFFHVNPDTLSAFLARNKSAREAWNMGRALGTASVRRLQLLHAKRHAGMSIWLGKVYLEQREVSQTQIGRIPGEPPVGIEHSAGRELGALLAAAHDANERRQAAKLLAPPQAALPAPIELEAVPTPEPMAAIPASVAAHTGPEAPHAPALAPILETPASEAPPAAAPTFPPMAPPSSANPPKRPPPKPAPPPKHPAAGLMAATDGPRICSEEYIESGGIGRPVPSDEEIYKEAKRRGLTGPGGQVSNADMVNLRKEMAGEPSKPSYVEVCEAAGAVRPRYPIFRR